MIQSNQSYFHEIQKILSEMNQQKVVTEFRHNDKIVKYKERRANGVTPPKDPYTNHSPNFCGNIAKQKFIKTDIKTQPTERLKFKLSPEKTYISKKILEKAKQVYEKENVEP